jgi:hypothetical protein
MRTSGAVTARCCKSVSSTRRLQLERFASPGPCRVQTDLEARSKSQLDRFVSPARFSSSLATNHVIQNALHPLVPVACRPISKSALNHNLVTSPLLRPIGIRRISSCRRETLWVKPPAVGRAHLTLSRISGAGHLRVLTVRVQRLTSVTRALRISWSLSRVDQSRSPLEISA